ncbi:hypothetical protein BZG02_02550 [Labilibaculum filiforme]|uniref:Uncharacterized protein n=1 Tax=Labilibaculum filiforme TaxID=1940526 RepID=A0A2N3I6H9_9BACT|nr:hypothetical protein [Labilibaculum filiforme]PKQ65901.1 hypothetical protein BZG02_02550 [Labilibaculum filiforme]
MKAFFIFVFVSISSGLVYSQTNDRSFNLVRDIEKFSELMTELDTIIVYSNLSICHGERYEKDIITKKNDSVFIQVSINDDFDGNVDYEKRIYEYDKSDSLNFETLYFKLQKHTIPDHQPSLRFEIIHNRKDTLNLFTYGLMDIIDVSRFIAKIKNQIYFDKGYYKPLIIPKEPVTLPDSAKNDSILFDDLERLFEDKK